MSQHLRALKDGGLVVSRAEGTRRVYPEPANASEIEIRFTADGPEQTTVEIEHRHLERLVAGQAMRDALVGGGDWRAVLELFAKTAAFRNIYENH